jgi:hypothetical protein
VQTKGGCCAYQKDAAVRGSLGSFALVFGSLAARLGEAAPPTQKSVEQAPISESAERSTISVLPRVQSLSPIQRHVLQCVAAHCWTHQGEIPYHPPTDHQAGIARDLAGPAWRLLLQKPTRKPTYILTRLGDAVARRVLQVVAAAEDRAREREFDRMRALMRHDLRSLTTLDVDDDEDSGD